MKDCIIVCMFSKEETSYANYYMDALKKQKKTFDVLYFDRYENQKKEKDNEIIFSRYCPTGGSKLKKIKTMWDYSAFIKKIADRRKYKSVIVLTTVPAVMLHRKLLKEFDKRYLLDIRDYTYENRSSYAKIEKELIRHSYSTVISSKGFLRFLPENEEYVISHNISADYKEMQEIFIGQVKKIHIGFVGSVRYYEENARLIDQFSNEERYILDYYGTTTADCNLQQYCKDSHIDNVQFHGAFKNNDKPDIYKNIDIINSIYGMKGLETTTAVPNRFYDAAIYKKPIIVSKGTYLSDLVSRFHLGFAVDVHSEHVKKELETYLREFNEVEFLEGCHALLKEVDKEMRQYSLTISKFIESIDR